MTLIPANCIEYDEVRPICIASEGSKTYTLKNLSGYKVRKVKIDGCFSQKAGEKRCDFLMSIDDNGIKNAIFIELKGGELNDAIKQLFSTIIFLKKEFEKYRIDARIVGTKDVPGFINTPSYRKLAKEIMISKGTIKRATNKILVEKI